MGRVAVLRLVARGLLVLVGAGLLSWVLLRPPTGTAAGPMLDAVDRVGQVRRVAVETAFTARQLAAVRPAAPAEELARARIQLAALDGVAARLADELRGAEGGWVPVAEAQLLLGDARELARAALALAPAAPVAERKAAAANPLETDPARTGLTAGNARAVEDRADQLVAASDSLRLRTRQAVEGASFARGTLYGYTAADLLLGLLVVAALAGWASARRAAGWLSVPPAEALQRELVQLARAEPRVALTRCHERARDLMTLADGICRGERV